MAVTVTAKKFKKPFSKLNGTKILGATQADIVRLLLVVGYPSRRKAVKLVGRWRERMLVAMATGYFEKTCK